MACRPVEAKCEMVQSEDLFWEFAAESHVSWERVPCGGPLGTWIGVVKEGKNVGEEGGDKGKESKTSGYRE